MKSIRADQIKSAIERAKNHFDFSFTEHAIEGVLDVTCKAFGHLGFAGCLFDSEVILHIERDALEINFSGATFQQKLTIHNNSEKGKLFFNNETRLYKGLQLTGKKYWAEFENCKIRGKFQAINAEFEKLKFDGAEFIEIDDDSGFLFHSNVVNKGTFTNCKLANAQFNSTEFNNNVVFDEAIFIDTKPIKEGNFWNVVFKGDASFQSANFTRACYFNKSQFRGDATFAGLNAELPTDADFSRAKFSKRSVFDHARFNSLKLVDCDFDDLVSFNPLICENLCIARTAFHKGADFLNSKIRSGDRETFRVIKNEFQKVNNGVEALHYYSKEMRAYEQQISFAVNKWEFILLMLNKLSNNHGLSWARGVVFTLAAAVIFYWLYLNTLQTFPFEWGWQDWSSFVRASDTTAEYFVRFFIVTHDLEFMNGFGPSGCSYVVDFIGKIFIGYGIYQTIQAFRKHGKG